MYNRYQIVERLTTEHLEFSTRPGSSCCEELNSVRLLVESVSGVLAQVCRASSISNFNLLCVSIFFLLYSLGQNEKELFLINFKGF